jgi:hypothetical protein
MNDLLDLVRLVAEAADAKWAETGEQQALEVGDILWSVYLHHLDQWESRRERRRRPEQEARLPN